MNKLGQIGDLRDTFAGVCLIGLMAEQHNGGHPTAYEIGPRSEDPAHNYAVAAYRLADAMLAVRVQGNAP